MGEKKPGADYSQFKLVVSSLNSQQNNVVAEHIINEKKNNVKSIIREKAKQIVSQYIQNDDLSEGEYEAKILPVPYYENEVNKVKAIITMKIEVKDGENLID